MFRRLRQGGGVGGGTGGKWGAAAARGGGVAKRIENGRVVPGNCSWFDEMVSIPPFRCIIRDSG